MTHHRLKATCETVHLGGFSHRLEPVLAVDPGDTVEMETYTGFYICDEAPAGFLTPEMADIYQNLPSDRKIGGGPHLLTGPIYVKGAEPGDTLEIRLQEIAPKLPIGYNMIRPGWGALSEQFQERRLRFLPLELEKNWAEFPPGSGIRIPLEPFFGIFGVAMDKTDVSSLAPGPHGGNMDNKELRAGSRVFLPVFVPGGLFSIGDGHAAQGDGEVNGVALETSMNGTIELNLHRGLKITPPFAETPTHWITMGFGETLDEAFKAALRQMIEFLVRVAVLSYEDAYSLCSLTADFRITQAVNHPRKGVHGMLRKSIFPLKFAM